MNVTVNFEGEWDSALAYWGAIYAQRDAAPGTEVTVVRPGSKLTRCPKCRGVRHNLGGPHAPVAHADGSQTDCVGDIVVAARAVAA